MARDEYGRWQWVIGRNVERCSVEQTELWAIYNGFHLEWDFKWKEVILEIDCAQAIKDIHGGFKRQANRDLILQIQKLCER